MRVQRYHEADSTTNTEALFRTGFLVGGKVDNCQETYLEVENRLGAPSTKRYMQFCKTILTTHSGPRMHAKFVGYLTEVRTILGSLRFTT
ncbi:hypothetical protein G7Y89_g2893 [Cudoniella acicularis]|uniref:Uncharacterized protein n=1 Tax=Cudoniella acicularis TaxID=354080 RepID=A0A8H4W5Q5_9HELO|nr:hypothetical protein G7Y89_g2893 [Cudoniella acicularis]